MDKIFPDQIRTLTRLRDTLLPKLMSGEVRVKSGQDGAVFLKENYRRWKKCK
jgi:hypothetical protein